MKDKKSIVILYSKGLYDTNALALADAIKETNQDCHVIAIGDDKYTNFGKGKLSKKSYVFSIRNARWAYSAYSNMTAKKKAPNKALKPIKADPVEERTGINKFAYEMTCRYHKVKNILRRYEPEIVLCFTPSVLKEAIKADEQLRMYTTKIYACLTDFSFDMRFFNRRCAGYIVQNEDIKRQLVNLGIEESKTYVTSIISRRMVTYDKEKLKTEMGIINDKPIVLMLGGRYGASIIKSGLIQLMNYTDNFNLVVLSGGSSTLVNVAKHIVDRDDSIFIVDNVDDINKMYNIADIIVATPTTCICSEALSYGKPLILLRGAGVVEKNNAKYLLTHNFAYDGTNKEKLIVALSDIILNKDKIVNLSLFAKSGDIENVASFILDKADAGFREKKILLAEKKLDNALDASDTEIVEEVVEDVATSKVKDANAINNDIQDINDDIIEEYNEEN